VLILMFLIHVIFFHGRHAHNLQGATSVDIPKERSLQERS
jgi:hypothetical protein